MKLEFQVFEGGDLVEWLNKANQYFELYQIPEDKKVIIASMHLSGKAADTWYMFKHEFPNSWQGLADLLMREFGPFNKLDYQATLAKMTQLGSVEDYKTQFTRLSRRASGFSQDLLLACFIGDLKDDIRINVRAQKPRTLYEACELAKVYEERHERHKSAARDLTQFQNLNSNVGTTARSNTTSPHRGFTPPAAPPSRAASSSNSSSTLGNRKLSQLEYHERRARNQCSFCDETYKSRHSCWRLQALLIEANPQCEVEEIPMEDILSATADEVPLVENGEKPLIQLNVIADDKWPEVMQLKGSCGNNVVHVMIDSGATHNFIHPSLLNGLRKEVKGLEALSVRVASGAVLKTQGG